MNNDSSIRLELDTDLAGLAVLEETVNQVLAPVADLQDAEAVRYNIWLSIHELCVNIIKHAYDGGPGAIQATFALEDDERTLVIQTYDHGPHKFAFDAWAPPDLSDPPIHGLGIFLIRQLMDEVEYVVEPDGSRWRLVKHLARAASPAAQSSREVTP